MRFQQVSLAVPSGCICYWAGKPLQDLQPDERAEVEQDRTVALLPTATVRVRLSAAAACPVHDPVPPLPTFTCRCGREVINAASSTTMDSIVVDAAPSPEGTLRVAWDDSRTQVIATQVRSVRRRFGQQLHRKHSETCTAAWTSRR